MSALSVNPFALLAQGEEIVVPAGKKPVQQQPPTSAKKLEKKINAAKKDARESQEAESARPPRFSSGREEGGYDKPSRGGRGGSRGGRGGRGGFGGRPPRREHDRHSATGIVDTDKKVTQGWGASTEAYGDDKAEPRADEEGKEAPFAPIEEEPVKTLDQYLAEKNAKKVGDAPAARKANEGADDAKWKDAKPLVKEEEAYFAGKSDAGSKKTKSKKAKAVVVIEQTFAEERRDGSRGGRGGRGGSRGARGAREGRGGRQDNGYGVNVDDASAFPELGA